MTSAAPRVSVVIPCYNHGAYLDQAVASVLRQSYADFEIVIVDDGSSDPATQRLLDGYDRPKTRVLHTANRGVSCARNTGISSARGDYILPLDADDIIAPSYLEKAVAILETRPEVGIVYCDQQMFGEGEGLCNMPAYDPVTLLFENLILSCAMYRKSDWEKVGGYSPKFIYGWEDWDFWVSMSRLNKQVSKIPEILYCYRIRGDSRDRSMRMHHKIAMMTLLMSRHKLLYLKNFRCLFEKIAQLVGKYLRPAFG